MGFVSMGWRVLSITLIGSMFIVKQVALSRYTSLVINRLYLYKAAGLHSALSGSILLNLAAAKSLLL